MPPKDKKDKEDNENKGKDNNNRGGKGKDKKDKKGDDNKSEGGGGGGGGGKGQCDECGVEKSAFNHCVHCAMKLCDECRAKHVEQQLDEFMGQREEAATCQRYIRSTCLVAIEDAERDIQISKNSCDNKIEESFKELNALLQARKAALLKENRVAHEEQKDKCHKEKMPLEKFFIRCTDKFKGACKISITPVVGAVASSFNKMGDAELAQVCVNTTTAKECVAEFEDIKSKMEQVSKPAVVSYKFEEELDELAEKIANFGKIEVEDPDNEDDGDGKKGGKKKGKKDKNDDKDDGKKDKDKNKKDDKDDDDKGNGKGRGRGRGQEKKK